jgi:hypothetical protein
VACASPDFPKKPSLEICKYETPLFIPYPDKMKNNGWIVWLGTLALLLLHQDFWFWDNYETEVFGFMPIGLAYHAGFSIVAALWWGAVMSFAWPHHLEALAEEQEEPISTQRP